jgi:hypothetical protein
MTRTRKLFLMVAMVLFAIVAITLLRFEPTKTLRGYSWRTHDGNTYLIVVDDDSRNDIQHVLDGKAWPHPINHRGPITPGAHKLDQTEFVVLPGGETKGT